MRSGFRKFFTAFLIVVPSLIFAQAGDSKQDKHEKEAERRKQEQAQMQEEALERGRKRQMQIQTKETRKRMKKNSKKARKFNEDRREFFLVKLFRRKK